MTLPKPERRPKVIELDCDKWWKIIGATLWAFASFGIYVGEYNMIQWSLNDKFVACLGSIEPDYDTHGYFLGTHCNSLSIWSPLDIIGMIFGTGATLVNTIGIWIVINRQLKIIEVKCRSKF